jgi:hypothetical protein
MPSSFDFTAPYLHKIRPTSRDVEHNSLILTRTVPPPIHENKPSILPALLPQMKSAHEGHNVSPLNTALKLSKTKSSFEMTQNETTIYGRSKERLDELNGEILPTPKKLASPSICDMEKFYCKVPSPACATQTKPTSCVRKIFITGTAGSGTHFVSDFLSKISSRGLTVRHESPTKSPDVLVSWPSRCLGDQVRILNFKELGFNDPKVLKKPMVDWANKQLHSKCAYKSVIHLVRHPLKFLSSNFAFGQCVECWALVERLVMPSFSAKTAEVRQVIADNRRRYFKSRTPLK